MSESRSGPTTAAAAAKLILTGAVVTLTAICAAPPKANASCPFGAFPSSPKSENAQPARPRAAQSGPRRAQADTRKVKSEREAQPHSVRRWRADLNRISGTIGEKHAQESAIRQGHEIIQPRGPATATGPDLISFDPKKGEIVAWDAKYRIHGRGYPISVNAETLKRWMPEVEQAVKNWTGQLKEAALSALKNNRVRGEIFRDRLSTN